MAYLRASRLACHSQRWRKIVLYKCGNWTAVTSSPKCTNGFCHKNPGGFFAYYPGVWTLRDKERNGGRESGGIDIPPILKHCPTPIEEILYPPSYLWTLKVKGWMCDQRSSGIHLPHGLTQCYLPRCFVTTLECICELCNGSAHCGWVTWAPAGFFCRGPNPEARAPASSVYFSMCVWMTKNSYCIPPVVEELTACLWIYSVMK